MKTRLLIAFLQLIIVGYCFSQSSIFGINAKGGNGCGHIFKYSTADDTYEVVHNFQHNLGSIGQKDEFYVHTNGKLYAFVELPCSIGISSYTPATNEYKVLNQTDEYANTVFGKPTRGKNGLLYGIGGMESDTMRIFSYNIQSNALSIVAFFNSGHGIPISGLTLASDGNFYFLTNSAICRFNPGKPAAEAISVLKNGIFPKGELLEVGNGMLYGTTNTNMFAYNYVQDTFAVKASLLTVEPNGLVFSSFDGMVYGTSQGNNFYPAKLFRYNPQTDQVTGLHTFGMNATDNPKGKLTRIGNKLYGTTLYGAQGYGGIFSFDLTTSEFVNAAEFTNSSTQGYFPSGTLAVHTNGKCYGMARSGGSYLGVIFEFDPNTGGISRRIRFDTESNNHYPAYEPLVLASDGLLYSWFQEFPNFLFSFDPATSTYRKRTELPLDKIFFNLADAGNGTMYMGVLDYAFPNDGSILKYQSQIDSLSVVYTNTGYPRMTEMIAGNDGEMYGYCQTDNFDALALCKYSPGTNSITLIQQLPGSYFKPNSLRKDKNGKIIGIPMNKYGNGPTILFSYDPASSEFKYLHQFPVNETTNYPSNFCVGDDQKVYGFRRDAQLRIFLFSYDLLNDTYQSMVEPDFGWNGYPLSELIMGIDNRLYVTESLYQSYKIRGSIFRLDPSTEQSEIVHHTGPACDGVGFGLVEVRSPNVYENCQDGHCWYLFPNPASETITLNLIQGDVPNSLQIYNAMGQLVLETDQLKSYQKLTIGELRAGIYVVRMNFSDVSVTTSLVKY